MPYPRAPRWAWWLALGRIVLWRMVRRSAPAPQRVARMVDARIRVGRRRPAVWAGDALVAADPEVSTKLQSFGIVAVSSTPLASSDTVVSQASLGNSSVSSRRTGNGRTAVDSTDWIVVRNRAADGLLQFVAGGGSFGKQRVFLGRGLFLLRRGWRRVFIFALRAS